MSTAKNSSVKVSCIINPNAANKKWLRKKRLRQYLQEKLPGRTFDILGSKENTVEIARKRSQENDLIIAIGGDGTISDVMQGIFEAGREEDTTLGIIPLGSGNAFRKSLGIPKQVKKAVKVLAEGKTRSVDLIQLGGKVAGFVSIGATANVTMRKVQHGKPGLLGHVLASREMVSYPPWDIEMEVFDGVEDDGTPFEKKSLSVRVFDCVINKTKHFGYSWRIAPKAKFDDSYLDVTLFETNGKKYFLFFPLIYCGIYQKTLRHFKARRVILRGKSLPIQYNGEVLEPKDELELKVLPHALKIICP